MSENSLIDLYEKNQGKISDKWSRYLHEYHRLFSACRQVPISLLEIGIQNGGSLQIWGEYFSEATHIIGCDINPLCEQLTYQDSRISVVVGDANNVTIYDKITSISDKFDFIIDDGSHTSGDIIKTFNLYFKNLAKEGVFIIEDLHCSYWDSFEGGLFYPYSSISFFKSLADIVNYEHWGINKSRSQLLKGFSEKYNISINEFFLKEIHSIEFVNSMCIIRKSDVRNNVLGSRIISGVIETAAPSHKYLNDTPYEFDVENFDQSKNIWSARALPPGEVIAQVELTLLTLKQENTQLTQVISAREQENTQLTQVISAREQENTQLTQVISAREQENTQLTQVISAREQENTQLTQVISAREQENTQLTQVISAREQNILNLELGLSESIGLLRAMEKTLSWRVTRPIRVIRSGIKNIKAREVFGKTNPKKEVKSRDFIATSIEDPAFIALSGADIKHENSHMPPIIKDQSKLIAFYLPQFHEIPENSEWWGEGFTEWTNVRKATPNFDEHYQPHIPGNLGYYDLSSVEVMYEQSELAKLFGIHGFCFYYYWFSGRRILERPLENFLNSNIDINFCLCWANENWTRTWDGDTKSVLMHQKYEDSDVESFLDSVVPYFKDSRYIRVDGCPLLVVYRAKEIPNTVETFAKWRALAKKFGFKDLHIAIVDFYDIQTPCEVGADALVEFPPHKFNGPNSIPETMPRFTNANFSGGLIDYDKIIAQSANRPVPDFKLYRGVIPSWDNTARRQDSPAIVVNETPKKFGEWMSYIRAYTRENHSPIDDNFIFINAWNEWGEGCHLEPDEKHGTKYLEEMLRSAYYPDESISLNSLRDQLFKRIITDREAEESAKGGTELSPEQLSAIQGLYRQKPQSRLVQSVKAALKENENLYSVARKIYRLFYYRGQG